MSTVRRHILLSGAIVRRDLLLAWSYRAQFVTGVFSGFISLAVFYYISQLVRVPEFNSSEYFAFAAIGILIFTIVNATLQLPQASLRQELVAGTFERILLAPWGSAAAIVSMLIYPTLYALVTTGGLLCIAAVVFGLELQLSTAPLAIPVAVIGLLAISPFGILLLAIMIVSKRTPPGANYIIAGLSLVAGLYFPVALLPGWIRWTSDVQPLTPTVELLRGTLSGQPLADPAWVLIATLLVFALVFLPITIWGLRRALNISRRRGTILEF